MLIFDKKRSEQVLENLGKPLWNTDMKFFSPGIQELHDLAEKTYLDIMAQREEILSAFIAKYGLQPDECVQVIQTDLNNTKWWVEKK